MTTPIILTDAMRDAVHTEDCVLLDHLLTMVNAFEYSRGYAKLSNPDGLIPHIKCTRCGKVWLIVENEGRDYRDAEAQFNGQLKTPKPPRVPKPRSTPK